MPKLNGEKNALLALQAVLSKEDVTETEIQQGMESFALAMQDEVLAKVQMAKNDDAVQAALGGIALDSEEKKFALQLMETDPNDFGKNAAATVPPTTIQRVMENLTKNNDLINAVDVINGGLTTEFIYSIGVNTAFWGALCAEVKELADKGFRKMSIGQLKLSAFIPVCKAFIDLNTPEWLINYVVTVLSESIALALELAIVDGTGKEQPIGMRRSLVDQTAGEQNVLTPIEIADFSPKSLGGLMAKLTKPTIDTVGNITLDRTINPAEVMILMNPTTYWTDFYPNYTVQNATGQFVSGLALPLQIKQSTAVPEGEYIIGKPKDYLFVLGKGATLGFSDEYRYIEDERVYLSKMYGNGAPKGENLFIRATLKAAAK